MSNLTSTQRQVLTNLYHNKPMWQGVQQVNPGAGIPAVVTSLSRACLIGNDLVRGGHRLTDLGKRTVEAFLKEKKQ